MVRSFSALPILALLCVSLLAAVVRGGLHGNATSRRGALFALPVPLLSTPAPATHFSQS